jgi:DNA-binding SARP family transcriptional activator
VTFRGGFKNLSVRTARDTVYWWINICDDMTVEDHPGHRPPTESATDRARSATEICLLGALRATIAGRRVDRQLAGRKGRLLFAFMALNRHRAFGRGELIDVLWPNEQPSSPDGSLSTVLSRLRQAVGEEFVQGRAELSLRLPGDVWVDVEFAEERIGAAQQALDESDPALALDAVRLALAQLTGALLPEFDEDWIEERRRALADQTAAALEISARACLAVTPPVIVGARTAARQLIEQEPWRETGYALLMRAHACSGDVAEGLRVFERLRVLLRDELGTRPSPTVLELHQQLLTGEARPAPQPAERVRRREREHVRVALPPSLESLARSQFVGRQEELRVLDERWRDVVDGRDGVVLVSGEPGIGKTALAARFAQRVHADGAAVLFGQCDAHSAQPYQPIAEALRHYCRQVAPMWEDRRLPRELAELGRIVPELRDSLPEDAPPAVVGQDSQRFRLFEAVHALLAHAAEQQPVLLILDDAQWADRSTLLLLRHVIRDPDRSRLLVLVTYRDVEVLPDHPLHEVLTDLERLRPMERIALEGLGIEETAGLVSAYAGSRPPPEILREWQERTDGHPFFLHEILRRTDPGAIESSADVDVPVSVKELIERRAAQLGTRAAATLLTAAVIGRQFDLDVLTALVGDSTETTIAALEDAVARGLIIEVPEQFDRFTFAHALVRETFYEGHSRTRLIRLHQRVGELLEHGSSGAPAAELAHHFFLARHVAGHERAVRYCAKAGDAAVDALAHETAAGHYGRALEALEAAGPEPERERCELTLALGEAQWRAGDPAVDETFARAAQSARARGDTDQLARAALGARNHESGLPDEARVALLEDALAAFRGDERGVLRVRVLGQLSEALHFAGNCERALALSAEAIDTATALGDPDARIAALMGRHAALLHVDHVDERLSLLHDLVVVAEETGRPDLEAHGHQWSTYALFECGDLAGVRPQHDRFARLTGQLHEPGYSHVALAWKAVFAQLDGNLDGAEQLAMEAYALAARVRGIDAVALLGAQLFFIRREQHRLVELVSALESFVESNTLPTWRAALTVALATAGETERAQRSFEISAEQGFTELPSDMWWLTSMALLSEGCAHLDDDVRAPQLYELLAPYAQRSVQVAFAAHLGSVQRHLGLLATTMGSWTRAEEHFEAALRRHAGSCALTVRTQCEYATMLKRRGSRGDGRRAADLVSRAVSAAGDGAMRGLVEPIRNRSPET